MKPVETISACRRSHRALLTNLAPLTDEAFRAPSLLPGYSRAHVVTQLTNKVTAHVLILGGPAEDEVRQLHPDGYDPDRAAESGAGRSAVELRTELAQCLERLEATWDALEDSHWEREGMMTAGLRTMREIVEHHLRNVEVHHVDLIIGHRPSDWPAILVESELPKRLRSLPDRAEHAQLLAWLLGRASAPELAEPW